MRPSDFPDFFRRDPPPGQSRESRIRLDALGRFWNGEELVTHRGMCVAFASWLKRHPHDGRYVLENGYDWTYIAVEDTPSFVIGLGGSPPELSLRLFDETEERAPRKGWRLRPDGSMTVFVREGQLEARLIPRVQAALGPWLDERLGNIGLVLDDTFLVIGKDDLGNRIE